eukprot:6447646-Amphidinium_carterae.1
MEDCHVTCCRSRAVKPWLQRLVLSVFHLISMGAFSPQKIHAYGSIALRSEGTLAMALIVLMPAFLLSLTIAEDIVAQHTAHQY